MHFLPAERLYITRSPSFQQEYLRVVQYVTGRLDVLEKRSSNIASVCLRNLMGNAITVIERNTFRGLERLREL